MSFLMTNIAIGKYYPGIFTQICVGLVAYVILIFMASDILSEQFIQDNFYYIATIIFVDIMFVAYQYRYNSIIKAELMTSDKISTDDKALIPNNPTSPVSKKKFDRNQTPYPSKKSDIDSKASDTSALSDAPPDISFSTEFKVSQDMSVTKDEMLPHEEEVLPYDPHGPVDSGGIVPDNQLNSINISLSI